MGSITGKKLGVNVDHVATLRQQRGEGHPNLLLAVQEVLAGGADGITVHLREDRRHIQDRDVIDLIEMGVRLNLEMAATDEMIGIATRLKPAACCLVPEKRDELTTEGGLDLRANQGTIESAVHRLQDVGIQVSLFVDPDPAQMMLVQSMGVGVVELNTGGYSRSPESPVMRQELKASASMAKACGVVCHAGHGLSADTIGPLLAIPELVEFNIGHRIVSRALWVGLREAVRELKEMIG